MACEMTMGAVRGKAEKSQVVGSSGLWLELSKKQRTGPEKSDVEREAAERLLGLDAGVCDFSRARGGWCHSCGQRPTPTHVSTPTSQASICE